MKVSITYTSRTIMLDAEADRLVEPEIRHVKIESATLPILEGVKAWAEATERDLLEQIRKGPIAIH